MLKLIVISVLLTANYGDAASYYKNGRIVGGENTTIEDYPYQLSIESVSLNGMHFCGASLLKPNVVLTAAHCTNGYKLEDLRVRAGTTTREQGGVTANVLEIYQHPKFTPNTIDCDVALLKLDRDLPIGSSIQTIDIQPKGVDVPEGAIGTVTGWGALHFGGPSPVLLQKVNIPKVDDDVCARFYPDKMNRNMMCFAYLQGGKDSCSRDSGGPIVVNGIQVGVVSFGEKCAEPNIPGVYSKLSSDDISNYIADSLNMMS